MGNLQNNAAPDAGDDRQPVAPDAGDNTADNVNDSTANDHTGNDDQDTDDPNAGDDTSDRTPNDHADKSDKSDKSDDDLDDEDDADDDLDDDDTVDRATLTKVRRRLRAKNSENKRLRARVRDAEARALRYDIAERTGLPLKWARRLQGDTEAEVEADAADMLAMLGHKNRVTPDNLPQGFANPGAAGSREPSTGDTLEKIARRIYASDH